MTMITTDTKREIIDDFAAEIRSASQQTAKPSKCVINFRNELASNFERDIVMVPIHLLRFRKDNGRIASDVLSYEKSTRPLSEDSAEDQEILRKFLFEKDSEKTRELQNSLLKYGQTEPAIITSDGFLINGNRRKMALEDLQKQHVGDEKFKWMRVVILPGKDSGAPTMKEIEQVENRYQLMSDGKAEYYNFDRALSFKHKMDLGISLEEQLRDDPNYANLNPTEFKKKMKILADEYLGPLECVDDYLKALGRDGLYDTVSRGKDDREGRWQAFIDFYNVKKKLDDKNKLIEMGIDEEEKGEIIDAAFKLIRKRDIAPGIKVHNLIRSFPKLLSSEDTKKEILKISEIDSKLPESENYDANGNELDPKDIDKVWGGKYHNKIAEHVFKAQRIQQFSDQAETPLGLLESALKKLKHTKMDLRTIQISDLNEAKRLITEIRERAKELEREHYYLEKNKEDFKENLSKS